MAIPGAALEAAPKPCSRACTRACSRACTGGKIELTSSGHRAEKSRKSMPKSMHKEQYESRHTAEIGRRIMKTQSGYLLLGGVKQREAFISFVAKLLVKGEGSPKRLPSWFCDINQVHGYSGHLDKAFYHNKSIAENEAAKIIIRSYV